MVCMAAYAMVCVMVCGGVCDGMCGGVCNDMCDGMCGGVCEVCMTIIMMPCIFLCRLHEQLILFTRLHTRGRRRQQWSKPTEGQHGQPVPVPAHISALYSARSNTPASTATAAGEWQKAEYIVCSAM